MELNKLERQFRESLSNREIKPSQDAWDRLETMLLTQKKAKRNRKWMYVAAGVSGFLLVGTFVLSQNSISFSSAVNQVARVKGVRSNDSINSRLEVVFPSKSLEQKNIVTLVQHDERTDIKNRATVYLKGNNRKKEKGAVRNLFSMDTLVKEQVVIALVSKSVIQEELLVEAKAKEEITVLSSRISVNSNRLLSQVDGELELSFREKVIEKVNKNYKTVKGALANRNLNE
jgi:hypothetical protein